MGLSLANLGKKLFDQVNPFDNGKTWSNDQLAVSPPSNQQLAQQSINNAQQQIANTQNKRGNLANPQIRQQFNQSLRVPGPLDQFNSNIEAGFSNTGRMLNDNIINPVANTVQIPFSAARLGVANLGSNKTAQQSARKNFGQDINSNLFSGNVPFEQSVASAIASPYARMKANQENQRAINKLTPAYENLYSAYGYDPRLGANQAQVEAGQAKQDILNEPLRRAGIGQNESLGSVAKKVTAQGVQAGLNTVFTAQMANGAVETAMGVLKNKAASEAEKTAAQKFIDYNKLAALNTAAGLAGTAQKDNATPLDYLKSGAKGYAVGLALPVGMEYGIKGVVGGAKVAFKNAQDHPLNEVDAVGKNGNETTPLPGDVPPQTPLTPEKPVVKLAGEGKGSAPKVTTYEDLTNADAAAARPTVSLKGSPTTADRVMANTTGVTPEAAMAERLASEARANKPTPLYTKAALAQPTADELAMGKALGMSEKDVTAAKKEMVAPDVKPRVMDAEAAALQHLQNGGLRDEAVKIYQDTAGVSEKAAKFQVQRAAREAKQSLNVSPAVANPYLQDYGDLYRNPTDAEGVARNKLGVANTLARAEDVALTPEKNLTSTDKANLVDYIQGVKDVSKAQDPAAVQQAIDAWTQGADITHAVGQNFGDTKHIDKFFPGYWDRENPAVVAMDKLKVEQNLEEQMGPDAWRQLTNDERQKLISEQPRPNYTTDANYGGFHNKGKIYQTQAEGIAANEKPMFDNPYDAMRRYFAGAKLQLGDQAVIQGARSAEPSYNGVTRTIDLTSGTAAVSPKLFKELKSWGVKSREGNDLAYGSIGKKIQAGDATVVGDLAKKGWRGLNTSIIKTIVANPIFHGGNQEFNAAFRVAWDMPGNKVGNMVKLVTNQLATSAEDRTAIADEYFAHGGVSPTYGKDNYGFIANGLQKAFGDNGAKLAEVSPRAMAAIEENIRLSLYDMGRARGMTPEEAITAIDRSLGGPKVLGDMSNSVGLFLHYFTTNVKSLGYTGMELTRGNAAPAVGLAIGYGAYVAANKAWQDVTGNPNASLRAPGVIGTATQLTKAPAQIKRGQVPTVITNHINPAINTIVGLAANRDLRKPVFGQAADTNKIVGAGGEGLGAYLRNNLLGPGQTVGNIASDKTSLGEAGLNAGLGAYLPHAKGNPAAPNLPIFNTPGAKTAPGNDPTGYKQQQAYFQTSGDMYKGMSADDATKLKGILAAETDPNGAKIGSNDKESMAKNAQIYAHPDYLDKITQQKQDYANKTGTALDPLYDSSQLTPQQRLDYIRLQSLPYKSDEWQHLYNANKTWIRSLDTARSAYFNSQDQSNLPPSQRVQPPNFSASINNLLDQTDKLSGQEKGQFISDHPELQDAYNQLAKYTADRIAAQGGAPRDVYPTATPRVQKIIDTYNAIPKGGGSKGGNKYRAQWIQAHPQDYAAMTNYFTQASLYGLEGAAAQAQFKDTGFTSKALGDIYNVGQYDIAKGKDSSGAPVYALTTGQSGGGPAYVDQNGNTFANLGSGSGSSSGGSGGGYSPYKYVSRTAAKSANPYLYAAHTGNDSAKHKKITSKKGSTKVALKSKGGRPSVSLKKSLV